jgi:SAM-dependent methyltransferase
MSEPRFHHTSGRRREMSPWWAIHEARYRFALQYVGGDMLLDAACGTGYGMPILLSAVPYAIGIDIDRGALQSAKTEVDGGNGALLLADGCHLPFANDTFTAITSFETIEHLEDRSAFVSELARVLAPGGVCLVSTPNAHYTRPHNGKPRNPYHCYEYTPAEFTELLDAHFSSTELIAQRLNRKFRVSPFWDDQQELHTPQELCRLAVWRTLNRMPYRMREPISRLVLGQPFAPSFHDYDFVPSTGGDGPTQLAICKKPLK